MTPDAAADAIEAAIETAWGATTPIAWPNVPFVPPATGAWLKVDFVWGLGALMTKDRRNGIAAFVQLGIFGPKDEGDGPLAALAETARAIFNRKRLASPNADVMFGAVSGPVTRTEESWRSMILTAPFRLEEVTA